MRRDEDGDETSGYGPSTVHIRQRDTAQALFARTTRTLIAQIGHIDDAPETPWTNCSEVVDAGTVLYERFVRITTWHGFADFSLRPSLARDNPSMSGTFLLSSRRPAF
ncbi:hypothetical protein BD309DRAFT_988235 [Dichomitus squalens]|uniref:Uncharacterized protein n=2 Tax=Dichomitus squalens TaxID=114155 RepID=A0A4Q9P179_9APHY|nr:uncharacterized protein DICSQDRAFT_146630 [Dichomitus squalens LYAD-421 SS1]EJF62357.1 hypothetical protein DICSQDRAFT_146630 [Dichomitus squalens LYAD-421 SS1]TBU33089.1 hypothetical protein BD311DRAFT_749191 [Dichomitus squalens]TBU47245.1 hypothetical protein BD309DRAFT_988235 [Dichomitus squalens]TBU63177.1 hypothetical protein BD310DRAFT_621012 [Dichomitus squalens]